MRWRLYIEEFGPELTYVKGENNVVADALSRMQISEEEFSEEAFASSKETADYLMDYPLSYAKIAATQDKDKTLQQKLKATGSTITK